MGKIKKTPSQLFRSWRWEADFDEKSSKSIGNIRIRNGFAWVLPDTKQLNQFFHEKQKFALCIRGVFMNEDEAWFDGDIHLLDQPILVSEAEDYYKQHRTAFLEKVQTRHIVDIGWVIQTYTHPNQVSNDRWWSVAKGEAHESRQQLWCYYHNKVKQVG